jgi:hypothetical protein
VFHHTDPFFPHCNGRLIDPKEAMFPTGRVIKSFKNIWGVSFNEDGTGASTFHDYSGMTGATPDGRKDRDLLNDKTVSPQIGTDVKGPIATMKSVSKIDHVGTFTLLFN